MSRRKLLRLDLNTDDPAIDTSESSAPVTFLLIVMLIAGFEKKQIPIWRY